MRLEGFPKDFFEWAQALIPASLQLTDGGPLVKAKGTIMGASGLWSLDLLVNKEGDTFRFFACQENDRSVEVFGHWPVDKETLASVLASLPRHAN